MDRVAKKSLAKSVIVVVGMQLDSTRRTGELPRSLERSFLLQPGDLLPLFLFVRVKMELVGEHLILLGELII